MLPYQFESWVPSRSGTGPGIMPRYFFDLSEGLADIADVDGTELPDDAAAVAHGYEVARDIMRHQERQTRHYCISIRDRSAAVVGKVPFAAADETIAGLRPLIRAAVERGCAQRREIAQTIHALDKSVRQSRALVARSRRRAYLCVADGKAVC